MNAKTKEHPADSIYYVDYRMLTFRTACMPQRDRWYYFFGSSKTPITLKVLRKMQTRCDECVHWAVRRMFSSGLISRDEIWAFNNAFLNGGLHGERIAFMDLLAARARREGRLL